METPDMIETQDMIEEPKGRKYMREYKRKKYAEDADSMKAKNKAYYKSKFGLNSEDMKKYDVHLPLVAKLLDNLKKLQAVKPEVISELLTPYI